MGPPQNLPPPPTVINLAPPPTEATIEQQLPKPPPPPQKHHHNSKHVPQLDPPPFPSVPMPDVEGLLGKSMQHAIGPSIQKVYAYYCFLGCAILYYTPFVTCICWGQDPDIKYWLGYGWVSVIFLPFMWILILSLQIRFKQPRRFIMILAMILGCVMFAGIGGDYYGGARLTATKLISSDCSDFFPEKRKLHEAYETARDLWVHCRTNKTITYWINTIEDCPGYSESSPHWKQWQYLKSAEGRFGCSGFCQERGQLGLWYPSLQTQDPCDESIGRKMMAVHKQALGILIYACVAFFFFTIWGFLVFPSLKVYIGMK